MTVTVVAIALTALVLRIDGGRKLGEVLGRVGPRRHLLGLLIGLGISFVVVIGIGSAVTATGLTRPDPDAASGGPVGVAVVLGLVQAFALQGIPEEVLFRGYLLRSVRLRTWLAVVVSALVFGAIHLVSSGGQQNWSERILYLAVPTGFALAAGALVCNTGSVAAAIGIHGGLHAAYLVSGLLAPRFPQVAIGEGPVIWVVMGAAYTLVGVTVLVRRRGYGQTVPTDGRASVTDA